ncbi:MAG: alkaline phosphatase D family protein [Polyangiaceae bacterium]|nr:alkaline phosphatase D family protein [Polyangiaceae bacterium]
MASRIGRRDFLAGLVVTVAVSPLGCSSDDDGGGQKPITYSTDPADQAAVYPQGIASGDPKPDSVILWTRALPKAGSGSVNVIYEIASDEAFETVIATGSVDVDETTDWTVRIKPTGLSPYTAYHYRFKAEQTQSVNGRTKTAPAADQDVPVRFAFASCQDFVGRYYHSWKAFLSEAPVDFVVWLGDYIYETDGDPDFQTTAPDRKITIPDGIEIAPKVKAAKSLEDYRGLYRQYRSDEHLQKVHASYPFIIIWDDHEFANDSWADHATDFNDKKGDEKSTARRENANQAWFEYQPADVSFDANQAFPDDLVIYRTLRYGKHVELFMTDQRSYRDDHCIPEGGKTSDKPAGAPAGMPTYDEAGKLSANSSLGSRNFCKKEAFDKIEAFVKPKVLGDKQKQWFVDGMKASTASWKFWGNETQLLQMTVDLTLPAVPIIFQGIWYLTVDQWDGFRTERKELLQALSGVENLVVLTGDIHAFYAGELHVDFDAPGAKPIGVEYVCAGISSSPFQEIVANQVLALDADGKFGLKELAQDVTKFDAALTTANPHYKHIDSFAHGIAIVDVNADKDIQVTFMKVADVKSKAFDGKVTKTVYKTTAGSNKVEKA